MKTQTFQDINWDILRKTALSSGKKKRKTSRDWDKKAAGFAQRTASSLYTELFIGLLRPKASWNILDVGCGPGTLALPLSEQVHTVSALDYSQGMLDILTQKTKKQRIKNISTYRLAWEDDWELLNIKKHDVAVASRSLAVENLRPALEKLNHYATELVCLTDKVGSGPHDPQAFAAIGRNLQSGPDYIYTVNLLYSMGIHASVNFIPLEETLTFSDMNEALANFSWMFQDLSEHEEKLLAKYVASMVIGMENDKITLKRPYVPTWAFISWKPR